MLGNKRVVDQVRVGGGDTVDLLRLAGAESFVRLEAPYARQKSLAAEDLVDAADTTGEAVGRVEERGIAVGDLDVPLEHGGRDRLGAINRQSMALFQQLDR